MVKVKDGKRYTMLTNRKGAGVALAIKVHFKTRFSDIKKKTFLNNARVNSKGKHNSKCVCF